MITDAYGHTFDPRALVAEALSVPGADPEPTTPAEVQAAMSAGDLTLTRAADAVTALDRAVSAAAAVLREAVAERDDAERMRRYHQNQRSKDARELADWRRVAGEYEATVAACQQELREVRAERDRLAAQVQRVRDLTDLIEEVEGGDGWEAIVKDLRRALDGGEPS